MAVYTWGRWKVTPGKEDEFINAWTQLATRTKRDFPESTATLLRDRDDPTLFLSFGPWESIEQIDRWRASNTFQTGVGEIRPLLAEFTPLTLDPVASV
jgi:heme-degrading monooxygenase HmoA